MYIVRGVYLDGTGSDPLPYHALDDALQKVRELIEADEIDSNGRMFVSYAIAFDHPAAGDEADERAGESAAERQGAETPEYPRLSPAPRAFYGDDGAACAWPLSDIRPLDPPIKYKHPGGGSWVRLSAENVPEFERLQEA